MQPILDFYSVYTVPRIIFTIILLLVVVNLLTFIYYEFKVNLSSKLLGEESNYTLDTNERKNLYKNSLVLFVIFTFLRGVGMYLVSGFVIAFFIVATCNSAGSGEAIGEAFKILIHPRRELEIQGSSYRVKDTRGTEVSINPYYIISIIWVNAIFVICLGIFCLFGEGLIFYS